MAEVVTCRQKGMAITEYYGKLKKLWEDLDHIDPLPKCSCGGCTCGGCKCELIKVIEEKSEIHKVHHFLFGLDEDVYGSIRTNLLAEDPIPNLNCVYNSLIQEESVKNKSKSENKTKAMSFAVQKRQKKGQRDERDKSTICTYCGRMEHAVEKCFHKHGYPNWYFEQANIDVENATRCATRRSVGRGFDEGRGNSRGRGKINGFG